MVKEAAMLPDSVFEYVKMEDLLDDEVYIKLAHDGWSPQEIVTIMKTALKDRKAAKNKFGYGWYAKQWLLLTVSCQEEIRSTNSVDTTYNEAMQASIAVLSLDVLNHTWPKIVYTPEDRKKGIRNAAYFRTVSINRHPDVCIGVWYIPKTMTNYMSSQTEPVYLRPMTVDLVGRVSQIIFQ